MKRATSDAVMAESSTLFVVNIEFAPLVFPAPEGDREVDWPKLEPDEFVEEGAGVEESNGVENGVLDPTIDDGPV